MTTEIIPFEFDGSSGASGVQYEYNGSPGNPATQTVTLSYVVDSDGSVKFTGIDGSGQVYYEGGGIDTNGENIVIAYIGGATPPFPSLLYYRKQ